MSETEYVSRRVLWLNRLSDEVVRGITARIRGGDLPVGAELPSRQALTSEFVTSDGVIEHAIHKLVAAGLVALGDDGNLRVVGIPRTAEALGISGGTEATHADVVAMLELRMGVETEAAALAAERRNEAQLAAIASAVEEFAAAVEAGARPSQADYRIHLAVAEASGNRYVLELTEHLGPLLIPRMRADMPVESGDDLQRTLSEHRAILEAIAAEDADAARTAMRRHLGRALEAARDIA